MTSVRRSVVLTVPGFIIPGLSSYLAFILIGRFDSDETLGLVSLAWIISNAGSAIVAAAPAHTALHESAGAGDREAAVQRFRSIVVVRSLVLGLILLVAAAVAALIDPQTATLIAISAPWLVGQSMLLFETEMLRARSRYAAASAVLAVRSALGWAAAVAGALIVGGPTAAVLPTAAVGLAVAVFLARQGFQPPTEKDRRSLRTIGRPVMLQSVTSYGMGYGDFFVVQALLGPSAVAVYNLAFQLGANSVELLTAPLNSALLPRLVDGATSGSGEEHAATALAKKAGAGLIVLAVAAPLGLLLLQPTGVFGLISDDPRLPTVAAIIASACAIQGVTRLGYAFLLARGNTRRSLSNFVVMGVVGILLSVLLTAQFGLVGTAVATFVGYVGLAGLTVVSIRWT